MHSNEQVPDLREIDVTQMPRDVWDLVSRFLSLEDLKNLSQVNRALVQRMRVLIMSKFRFIVSGTLADFRALGWTRACLNIRLIRRESVPLLSKDDVFLDIVLPKDFNASVNNISWPSRLTHLTFGQFFDQPVDHLPASLTHLVLEVGFKQTVDHLPSSLTHLVLGDHFNRPVDRLPASLTHLTFGSWFNQPVDHLPASLTHLTFGAWFNQPVNHLPTSLTHLTFGWEFEQPVNRLPASLKRVNVPKEDQIYLFAPEYRHLIVVVQERV
jgi:hypothetical protein